MTLRNARHAAQGAGRRQGVAAGAPVPYSIRDAERRLTEAHADAVKALLRKAGLIPRQVALIGFHGQTILHRPEQRWTWQIGDGALLARLTGIDVVNDFRSADVKAGGQGAPLVPLYHAALVRKAAGIAPPVVMVNIGGVANVTYVGGETILAFDTGPGNAPIDDWAHAIPANRWTKTARFARTGRSNDDALNDDAGATRSSIARPNRSTAWISARMPSRDLSAAGRRRHADGLHRRLHRQGARAFPRMPNTWIVCGGGRHNKTLMDALRARVNAPVLAAEDAGWNGDFIEAEAFAYLAARSVKGLPLSLPTTTGVPEPMTGGKLHRAPGRKFAAIQRRLAKICGLSLTNLNSHERSCASGPWGVHGMSILQTVPMTEYETALSGMVRVLLDVMIDMGAPKTQLAKELKTLTPAARHRRRSRSRCSAAAIEITMRSSGLRCPQCQRPSRGLLIMLWT